MDKAPQQNPNNNSVQFFQQPQQHNFHTDMATTTNNRPNVANQTAEQQQNNKSTTNNQTNNDGRGICLRRCDHNSKLSTALSHMLLKEFMVDVTIYCDDGQLNAHKLVLAASSSYFRSLFLKMPNTHHYPIIVLRDIAIMDLKTVIDFMYYGEVTITSERYDSIMRCATFLLVEGISNSLNNIVATSQQHGTSQYKMTTPSSTLMQNMSAGQNILPGKHRAAPGRRQKRRMKSNEDVAGGDKNLNDYHNTLGGSHVDFLQGYNNSDYSGNLDTSHDQLMNGEIFQNSRLGQNGHSSSLPDMNQLLLQSFLQLLMNQAFNQSPLALQKSPSLSQSESSYSASHAGYPNTPAPNVLLDNNVAHEFKSQENTTNNVQAESKAHNVKKIESNTVLNKENLAPHDYKCKMPNCPKSYKNGASLKRHHTLSHNIKVGDISCDTCKKKFKSEILLKSHNRNHHSFASTLNCSVKVKDEKDPSPSGTTINLALKNSNSMSQRKMTDYLTKPYSNLALADNTQNPR